MTLGASSAAVAGDFFTLATDLLTELGARVVLVTGPAPAPAALHPARAIARDFVSFDALLPHCRAIVHHGGVGTMVAAARAGVPQVVVPGGFDQPDTATRVVQEGIGTQVPWRRRHRHLEGAIREALEDPEIAARAAAFADTCSADGAARAASVLETLPKGPGAEPAPHGS